MTENITELALSEHPLIDTLIAELGEIEMCVLTSWTLADAMREGAGVSGQKVGGWVEGNNTCGWGAAYVAARARGLIAKPE